MIEIMNSGGFEDDEGSTAVVTRSESRVKRPKIYNVFLLNDDFTPMEFVVDLLERHFNKDHAAATEIMLNVHKKGRGLCGRYPRDIAETKVAVVTEEAKHSGYPLKCVFEPDGEAND